MGRTVQRKRPATYADVLAAPEHMVAELIDGELFLSPRPRARHAYTAIALGADLLPPFMRGQGGPGGWILLIEPELHLGAHVVVPDLAAWRRERLPEVPDVAFFDLAPDWVCEILSPGGEVRDRKRKMPTYLAAGVKHAWLVHPGDRYLAAYVAAQGRWDEIGLFAVEDEPRAHIPPFDALELDLTRVFAPEPP